MGAAFLFQAGLADDELAARDAGVQRCRGCQGNGISGRIVNQTADSTEDVSEIAGCGHRLWESEKQGRCLGFGGVVEFEVRCGQEEQVAIIVAAKRDQSGKDIALAIRTVQISADQRWLVAGSSQRQDQVAEHVELVANDCRAEVTGRIAGAPFQSGCGVKRGLVPVYALFVDETEAAAEGVEALQPCHLQ